MKKYVCILCVCMVSCVPITEKIDGNVTANGITQAVVESSVVCTSFVFTMRNNKGLMADCFGTINSENITITIEDVVSIDALIPSFQLSDEAVVFINGIEQISGESVVNFYDTVIYQVVDAEQKIRNYYVTVIYDSYTMFLPETFIIVADSSQYILNDYTAKRSGNEYVFYLPLEANLNEVVLDFKIREGVLLYCNEQQIITKETKCDLESNSQFRVIAAHNKNVDCAITINRKGLIPLSYLSDEIYADNKEILLDDGRFEYSIPENYTFGIVQSKNVEISQSFDVSVIDRDAERFIVFRVTRLHDSLFLDKYISVSNGGVIEESEAIEENDELYGDGLIMYGFACSGAGGANDEFVILFNNSLVPIDLSGFKIKYSAASGITLSNKFIFAENLYTIQPGRFVLISGKSYLMGNWRGDTFPDCVNTRDFGFSGTSGHVVITNADNVELDRVGYGSALKPEVEAVYNTSGGYYVHRNESCIDTNNNAVDFSFYDETGDGLLRNSNSLR